MMTTAAEPTEPTYAVSEVFKSLQGEGPSAGQQAWFIRLGGCNLACSWCDTPYTWDWERYSPRTELRKGALSKLCAPIAANPTGLVVITGGEPLLWERRLAQLVWKLRYRQHQQVEVETNGTRMPYPTLADDAVSWLRFNVSLKLSNSGQPAARRLPPGLPERVAAYGPSAIYKFVCNDASDLDEIAAIVEPLHIPPRRVWIMPEGTSAIAVLNTAGLLVEPALARGYQFSLRTHTLLWGDARGR